MKNIKSPCNSRMCSIVCGIVTICCGSVCRVANAQLGDGRFGGELAAKPNSPIVAARPGTLQIINEGGNSYIYAKSDNPNNPESGSTKTIGIKYVPRSGTNKDWGRAGLGKRHFNWSREWNANMLIDVALFERVPVSAKVGWRIRIEKSSDLTNAAAIASNSSAISMGISVGAGIVPISASMGIVTQEPGLTVKHIDVIKDKTRKVDPLYASEDTPVEHPPNAARPLTRELQAWVDTEINAGNKSRAFSDISMSIEVPPLGDQDQESVVEAYPFVTWPEGSPGQVKR